MDVLSHDMRSTVGTLHIMGVCPRSDMRKQSAVGIFDFAYRKITHAVAFFVGVLAQMFQFTTNVSFLHKSFNLELLPTKKAMVVVLYVICISFIFI